MSTPRVWLITGASSGFGKALTEVLLRKGEIVVATLRTPSALANLTTLYPPSQLLVLSLDVTRPDDIAAAFARTKDVFGRLDVVFNNAGYAMVSEAEGTSNADARALFDVNFWGSVDVSLAAVRFFREVNPPGKGGIILQNSSITAILGTPGMSFYCASKHAIAGFTESLSRELPRAWNIRICILEPGTFDTGGITNTKVIPSHPAYAEGVTVAVRHTYDGLTFDGDPYKYGETLYRLVVGAGHDGKIPLILPLGEDALEFVEGQVKKLQVMMASTASWSMDLKKDQAKL